jgi:hypothetical protein
VNLQRSAGAALLLIFLAVHLALLPRTLEDIDSINFALGVRDFDVARHQPHPPGYPVYIAAAKLSTAALRVVGIDAPAPRGLAIWSAVAGTAAIPALYMFFRRLEGRATLAFWATVVVGASPLFWFTALRPLSDMLGFAAAMWALALLAGRPSRRELLAGALVAGVAVGIRSQTFVLTVPFLALALARARDPRAALQAGLALAAGGLVWAVPLIVGSGGLSAYLAALSFQADADFSGVVMLWTHPTPRAALTALKDTFIWPWGWWPGIVACALAAAGAARIAWRAPRVVVTLLGAFAPYAIFHLLFQETVTTRYALPLVPVIAYAALAAVEGLPARAMPAAAIGVALLSLLQAAPASVIYAREGAPVFRAFEDMAATAHGGERVDTVAMHARARRAAEWAAPILPGRVAKAPHGREWLTLVALWKAEPAARVWFVADPVRTDLALFDPHARKLARAYRWGFVQPPFVGGARPDNVDWYQMDPPNWMLDRGWSLTAEVGGIAAVDRMGPHVAPATAWLKRRPEETTVVLGGRVIGSKTVTLDVTLDGRSVASLRLTPGFFFHLLTLAPGQLNGSQPYLPLEVKSSGDDHTLVSLEQFDAQPAGVRMLAYDTGWHEPEFSLAEGRSWRWMSEKAALWVRPIGQPLTLRINGESALRYYDAAPSVRVLVGDQEVAAFSPGADFEQAITLPADLLARANGHVVLESSKSFVPAAAGEPDQRRLALRIYRVSVD